MFLSFIKIKQSVIPLKKENLIERLPVNGLKKPMKPSDPGLRRMIILSCAVHCVVLGLFFFIQSRENRLPQDPLAQSTLVSIVNLNDLPGRGESPPPAAMASETKKEEPLNTSPVPVPQQKKTTVKQTPPEPPTSEKLPEPPPPQNAPPVESAAAVQPVSPATSAGSDTGNNADFSEHSKNSGSFADGGRESFSSHNGSGATGIGSGANNSLSGGAAAKESYLTMIRSKIEQHKIYPRRATLRQIQGTVVVHFIITLEGIIKGIDVVQSSGFAMLDRAGLKAVRDASPFPKPPADSFQNAVAIEVPLVFELT